MMAHRGLHSTRLFIKASGSVFQVWQSVDGRSELPCPLSPTVPKDRAVLVLWFKDGSTESIYSYDARKDDFSSGHRWQDEHALGGRSFFTLATLPPALIIDPSKPEDQGMFTCRVEYVRSPSTFTHVNLSIIIPPHPPSIFWDGEEVIGSIGPLREGEKAELICITKGGRPTPTLTWWLENHQLESLTEAKVVVGETVIISRTVVEAQRHLFQHSIVCHAHAPNPGTPRTEPRSVSAVLNITLPPVSVKISGVNDIIPAGSTVHPICITAGSHPPAEISWTLGGKIQSTANMSVMEGGNLTRSSLTIHTTKSHNRMTLQCQALNKLTPNSSLADAVKLNIIFKPEVHLELGRMLNASNLVEGMDAFFECRVQANPIPHRIEWCHNTKTIEQKVGVVVVSGANLGLQKLKKEQSGEYRCAVENLEGKTLSNVVTIHIKYAPICATEAKRTQGAAVGQESKIMCRVEADPIDDIRFTWSKLLPSGREMRIPVENVTVEEVSYQFRASGSPSSGVASSFMMVTPSHIGEFGMFICRSRNRVGKQQSPCIVSLVSAGPPEPPYNCSAIPGDGALKVTCKEGFNGGFLQKFRMMAFLKGKLISKQTSEFPEWSIDGLKEGSELRLEIRSQNPKGQSNIVTFLAHMPIAHQQSVTEPERSSSHIGPLVWGVLGGVVGLVLLLLLAAVTLCRRRRVRKTKTDDEAISVGCASDKSGGDGPDVVASVQRNRRTSSPAVDVLEYASGPDTDGALSTENTDDDASYQLHPSPKEHEFPLQTESASNLPLTMPKSLILKPGAYASSSHLAKLQQQKREEQHQHQQHQSIVDGCTSKSRHDDRRRRVDPGSLQELGLAVISKQNGGAQPSKEKLKYSLARDSRKDSYRPYERGKDEKLPLTNPSKNRVSRDVGLGLIDHNIKKDQNLEAFQLQGKMAAADEDTTKVLVTSQMLPNMAKRRNASPVLNGSEEKCFDETETLLKDSKDYAAESIKESEV